VHPNWAVHPVTGDRYTPYNKPASIVHWCELFTCASAGLRRALTAPQAGAREADG
jgi:hypothetical protein